MDLLATLRPSSVAVVGASPRTFVGQVAIANCSELKFSGTVYPVGRHAEVAGKPCAPTLRELPEVPEVVLVQLSADKVLPVVRDAIELGVASFVIPGAGFTDSGHLALEVRRELRLIRRHHDITVIGPNCMGFIDLVTGAAPYVGTAPTYLRRGGVAVVSQSGAIVEAVVNAGGRVPLSTVVSSGSEATTRLADYLNFFSDDPHTDAVLCYVESLDDDGEATLAAVRRLSGAGKRVAACVVGRSATAVESIAAHSGKLAPSAKVMAGAFRQSGAVLARDLDELLAFGEIFGTGRHPRGTRMHLVTNSGGEGSLLADIADEQGLELPALSPPARSALQRSWPRFHARNPLDPWGADDHTVIYPEVLRVAAAEPGDVLAVAIDQQRTSGAHEKQLGIDLARWLADAVAGTDKFPVLLSPTSQDPDDELTLFCRQARIALLRGARPALSALARAAGPAAVDDRVRCGVHAPLIAPARPPTEDETLTLLAQLGVAVPRRFEADDVDEAVHRFEELGGPVVLKGVVPGLLHKTELGLVRTDLHSAGSVRAEASAMRARAEASGLSVRFLLAEMVYGELEVLVGYKRDRVFGPTVMVGSGGVWAEFHDDVEIHVGSLDHGRAERLLAASRVGRMMARARAGALHSDGVVAALCAVSALGEANPDVVGIDINPIIVGRHHATAVDAVIDRG